MKKKSPQFDFVFWKRDHLLKNIWMDLVVINMISTEQSS